MPTMNRPKKHLLVGNIFASVVLARTGTSVPGKYQTRGTPMKSLKSLKVGLFAPLIAFVLLASVTSAHQPTAGGAAPALSSGAAPASAPVGTQFAYQGRLVVADGAYDFVFRLYNAASAGTKIGADVSVSDAAVKATVYNVALNFGANAFFGDARWLEVSYRPGASTGSYTLLAA